jgi:2-dehydropantoate 2-reductase
MKILIIGCGAIGSYYGAKLEQGGAKITTILRSNFDQAKTQGINIKSLDGNYIFRPQIISDYSQYKEDADYILICTKVLPQINIIESLKLVIKKNTAIILIQNGLYIENDLVNNFPDNEIIRGLAFICVSKLSPTLVDHQDYGRLVIGKYPSGQSVKVAEIAKIWQNSGLECQISDDIKQESWKKLIWNAPFNPISVLSNGANTKDLLSNKYSRQLIINVMKDVIKLANIDGCNFNQEVIDKFISYTEAMKPYKTSMLLDFENKRDLEIEAILGNTVRFAKQHNIDTSYLNAIYGMITLFVR